jgi:signal transduction histidine kinase
MNLLLNARDALGGTGTITVRTGAGRPDLARPSAEPGQFLEVEDNGPGIPPRALERIFEPGFTTRARAQGLGLTVVRSIVEDCGGSIQVDTEAMRGTRIRVLLPSAAPPHPR